MMFENAERMDQLSGEHVPGPTRLAEEESRKNKYYGMFRPNMESIGGKHGDRNKEGSRDRKSGYE